MLLIASFYLAIFAFILAVILYKIHQRNYQIQDIPGPISLPFIGNSHNFAGSVLDIFEKLHKIHETYGPVVQIWPVWLEPSIFLNDADAIQAVLNSMVHITKSREYRLLSPWLGTGLLISTGEKWHKRRKLLTPAFHFKILEDFIEVFYVETETLIEKLSQHVEKKSVDIYPLVKLCALDIICKTAMGTSINAQKKDLKYVRSVKEFLDLSTTRNFSIWKCFEPVYKYSSDYPKLMANAKILHNFTDSIIKNRKEMHRLNKLDFENQSNAEYKKKFAFLDLLIKAAEKEGLSDEDIREEVDTFTFEGHDTITTALSFTLYEIARHPEIQEKIYEEIKSVFPEDLKSEPVSYSNLQDLAYMGLVIKEGLRLYPPVPFFMRDISEPIPIGKYTIPAKSSVVISTFSIQRQEKHFTNADQFIPERFLPENVTNQHPFCYIPFSAGPRNCIGQKFAMLEMKSILARLILNFRLLPDPDHKLLLYTDSILKSLSGHSIKIERRE